MNIGEPSRQDAVVSRALADIRASTRVSALPLVGIILLAVVLRVVSALVQGDIVVPLPGIFDQISYDALARQVLAGHGFRFAVDSWPLTRAGEPTAHWSYLYTVFLASVYRLFEVHPIAARLIQAVVAGVLQPWLVYRIGRRVFGVSVGLAAAAITAVYIYFVYYAAALMTETFYVLAVLWALDLATALLVSPASAFAPTQSLWQRRSALWPWVLLGLALGAAALLRQLLLGFVPFVFVWLAWITWRYPTPVADGDARQMPWRTLAVGLLTTVVVIGLMIVPWTVRNYLAFHRFVLLNTNAGYAFFWANHPIHGTEFISVLPGGTYQMLIPGELWSLDEAALDQELMRRGIGFVVDDPQRYILLSLSRVQDYFQFWPSAASDTASNLSRVLSFGIMLPFMLYGLVLTAVRRRRVVRDGQWPAVVLLYLFISIYSLIHLLSWSLIRYRLPVDAILIVFAGVAIVDLIRRLSRRPG